LERLIGSNSARWIESASWIEVLPLYGSQLSVVVAAADIVPDVVIQVFKSGTGVNPTSDDVALDLGEPQLDLVQPAGIRASEVQVNLRMDFAGR
jgi:hypothetical protein